MAERADSEVLVVHSPRLSIHTHCIYAENARSPVIVRFGCEVTLPWWCGGAGIRSIERITIDPAICHGKPCVRGLRYPVELILAG